MSNLIAAMDYIPNIGVCQVYFVPKYYDNSCEICVIFVIKIYKGFIKLNKSRESYCFIYGVLYRGIWVSELFVIPWAAGVCQYN
jgi:hypothetical protein